MRERTKQRRKDEFYGEVSHIFIDLGRSMMRSLNTDPQSSEAKDLYKTLDEYEGAICRTAVRTMLKTEGRPNAYTKMARK